ncbi:MAG TPA: hypothetical protein VKZ42_02585 [Flavobacteriaceae bacterium]|nr:hypothetical protein [Flavobacteriaceae bacterium]
MRNIFLIFAFAFVLNACDDGDLIVTSFDFEEINLKQCGTLGNYVFFKINNDNFETLSLRLQTTDSILFKEDTVSYTLSALTNTVNYRLYDDNIPESYFCSSVPPLTPKITTDYISESGTVTIQTRITDTIEEGAIIKYTYTAYLSLHNLKMISEDETIIQEVLEFGEVNNTH